MDINILDFTDKDSIIIGLKNKNKKGTLTAIIDFLIEKKKIKKEAKKEVLKSILQREEMGSTAIGGNIALPHARVDFVKLAVLCFVVSKDGIDFDSLDQEPVHIIALLLSNQKEAGLHLKMLAFLARMLRDKYFIQQIKNAKTSEEVLAIVSRQQHIIR